MTPHDPEARAAARLAEDAPAWLPTDDPDARRRILALLGQVLSTGVDPLAALRAALTHWFGPAARIALPPPPQPANRRDPPTPLEGIAIETLPLLRKPTLWPQRPKRRPDELFSSWLRRAAIAAGVSPHRFARDALGTRYSDTDRDIPEATLRRLALVSGQRFEHLANGTLAAMPHRPQTSRDGLVQDTVLHDGRLLLGTAPPGTRAGRPGAVLQYCPTCLAEDTPPCFRRGWRFAFEVVCIPHQCRLHDACWQCGAPIALLAQRTAAPQPVCPACDAVLADGPSRPASDVAQRQRGLICLLYYLAVHVPPAEQRIHLDSLAARLRAGGGSLAARQRALANLHPSGVLQWFGRPTDPRHIGPLRIHAAGTAYAALFGHGHRSGRRDEADALDQTLGLVARRTRRRRRKILASALLPTGSASPSPALTTCSVAQRGGPAGGNAAHSAQDGRAWTADDAG